MHFFQTLCSLFSSLKLFITLPHNNMFIFRQYTSDDSFTTFTNIPPRVNKSQVVLAFASDYNSASSPVLMKISCLFEHALTKLHARSSPISRKYNKLFKSKFWYALEPEMMSTLLLSHTTRELHGSITPLDPSKILLMSITWVALMCFMNT